MVDSVMPQLVLRFSGLDSVQGNELSKHLQEGTLYSPDEMPRTWLLVPGRRFVRLPEDMLVLWIKHDSTLSAVHDGTV